MSANQSLAAQSWVEIITSTYLSIRMWGTTAGVLIVTPAIFLMDWPHGWITVTLLMVGLVHIVLTWERKPSPTIALLWDTIVFGIIAWNVNLPMLSILLVWPVAVALVLGDRRNLRRIAAIAAGFALGGYATSVLAAGTPMERFIRSALGDQAWTPSQVDALSMTAAMTVSGLTLLLLAMAAGRVIALERARTRLLDTIGHDLRNAVGSVLGLSHAIDVDLVNASELPSVAKAMKQGAEEALALIEDLLTMSRSQDEGPPLAEVPVAELVASVATGYSPEFAAIEIEVDGTHMVLADRRRAGQILRNLIVNARNHGGDHLRISSHLGDTDCSISVSDNGTGVPDEATGSLFADYAERFPTNGAGMGIGLSLSRTLALQMGGDLTYRRNGDWTTFELRLPRHTK